MTSQRNDFWRRVGVAITGRVVRQRPSGLRGACLRSRTRRSFQGFDQVEEVVTEPFGVLQLVEDRLCSGLAVQGAAQHVGALAGALNFVAPPVGRVRRAVNQSGAFHAVERAAHGLAGDPAAGGELGLAERALLERDQYPDADGADPQVGQPSVPRLFDQAGSHRQERAGGPWLAAGQ